MISYICLAYFDLNSYTLKQYCLEGKIDMFSTFMLINFLVQSLKRAKFLYLFSPWKHKKTINVEYCKIADIFNTTQIILICSDRWKLT